MTSRVDSTSGSALRPGGFAETLARVDRSAVRARMDACDGRDVRRAIAAERPEADDLAALLSPAAEALLGEMATRAEALTRRHFGRAIQLYVPLYVSNACDNGCTYCGFSARTASARRTLSLTEAVREAEHLRALGFRHVLLVSGESPRAFSPQRLAEVVSTIRPRFDSIAIEVFPMDEAGYLRAVEAGADGLALYQETYDRATYAEVHPRGPKRDFDWRLDAPERAARAGMRSVGVGFLMGLADARVDAYCTAFHATYLARTHWRTQVAVSFPRMRDAGGAAPVREAVSDRQFVQTVLAARLFLPQAGLVLSTREDAPLRDALLPYGITQMSAGSRTEPGGYTHPGESASQFAVGDTRTAEEVSRHLREAGFDPVWKDWDAAFSQAGGAL